MGKLRKMLKKLGSKRGFTLIELLMTVVISLIVMAAVFEVFIAQKRSYITEGTLLELENSGHFAIEYLTRTVQNSGYNIKNGMKIEAASDHYLTAVMDEDDNGVIESDEIVIIAINTPYLDIGVDTQPTELVHDPNLSNLVSGGPHEYYMDVYFDMNEDEKVTDSEKLLCGYNLDDTADDDDVGQMDAVKLYLNGPPYSLYRYSFILHDDSSPYDSSTNPYVVNPKPDTIADNVENFILRYYDEENLPLPATTDENGNRIAPKPPYILTREEMGRIRRVEFDILIRSAREDTKWEDEGSYPVGSVATYESGLPKGWTCSDDGFRDEEPYLTNCSGYSDWECFITNCNLKEYPTYGESIPYSDNYRRLFLTASATPKNLILNPYGRLTLDATPAKLRCPDNEVELTATLKDKEGLPIANSKVNFYSTANLSILDYSDVSSTDGDGNPITDANGEVSGIKLMPYASGTDERKPVTITISADSTITVNIDGIDKEFPVYSSITVPFIVGPPATLEYKDTVISTYACDTSSYKKFEVYAKDCNEFEVDGAQIEFEFYDGSTGGTLDTNKEPGKYFIMEPGPTRSYFDSGPPYIASEVEEENGMYEIWYEAPKFSDLSKTYPPSLGIKANATMFEDKPLSDPEPDGWGISTIPTVTKEIVLETGKRPFYITADPSSYSDSGCRGNDTYVYVEGFDCGGYPIHKSAERDYEIFGEVENASNPSAATFGELTDSDENTLSPPNYLPWDNTSLKFIAKYLVTGCANLDVVELIKLTAHSDTSGTEYNDPDVDEKEIDASLAECPEGLNLVLRAKGPHTDPFGDGELTDGFFREGCDYDNLDIEARVILNVPPTTNCEDIVNNPVTFTITSGSSNARFLDTSSGDYDLTNVEVYTDSEAKATIPIKLLSGCSLSDIVIYVSTSYGSYSASEYMTLPVVPDDILFMYRDSCYTDRLTSSSALRTGDTIYLEVRDCCRDVSGIPDELYVKVYEYTSTYEDEEYIMLTETGNNTGVFRGSVMTRGLPAGWESTDYDYVLDITNGGHINMRYWDTGGTMYIHDDAEPYISTIVDKCTGGIRIMENFTESANDGLDDDEAVFPFFNTNSSSWAGFSTANITESSSPVLVPDADTFKLLMMQYCDEFFISGSIPFTFLWDSGSMLLPPSTQPPIGYPNSESFVWVDLDESIVGEDNSETSWSSYTLNFRFKYIASPEVSSYTPVDEVTVGDYYLPSSVDNGVFMIFRAASSEEEITAVTGSPTMEVLNRGYFMVWTKDSSGNPLVQLYRIDNPNWESPDPITLVISQVGEDVTQDEPHYFTTQYDDGSYHRVYASFDGEHFDIWIDDQKLDFNTITGYSAHDRNFYYGTAGFGVKNIIAKFDNFQVCGCPPMTITADDATFPEGTEVELTISDILTGYPAIAPVNWTVSPTNAGEFSDPSTGTTVGFTRDTGDPFPDYFKATDANVCIAYLYPEPPTPTCFEDDFEADKGYTLDSAPGSNWDPTWGTWTIINFNGSWVCADESSGGPRILELVNPSAEPYWETSVDHSTGSVIGTYDNYSIKADIYFDSSNRAPSGGTMAGLVVRYDRPSNHYYTVVLRNEYGDYGDDGDVDVRISRYNGSWNYRFGVDISNSWASPAFPTDTLVTMQLDVVDNTIRVRVYDSTGSLYTYTDTGGPDSATANDGTNVDFTWTDSWNLFKTGGPGFRCYSNGAKFDNLEICPNP